MLKQITLAAAFAAAPFNAHALIVTAGSGPESSQAVAHIDGLDLTDPYDAKTALRRIRSAVRDACGGAPVFGVNFAIERHSYEACKTEATDKAVKALDAPRVTALHYAVTNS